LFPLCSSVTRGMEIKGAWIFLSQLVASEWYKNIRYPRIPSDIKKVWVQRRHWSSIPQHCLFLYHCYQVAMETYLPTWLCWHHTGSGNKSFSAITSQWVEIQWSFQYYQHQPDGTIRAQLLPQSIVLMFAFPLNPNDISSERSNFSIVFGSISVGIVNNI
jgi:hypothetical protein